MLDFSELKEYLVPNNPIQPPEVIKNPNTASKNVI